MYESLIQISRFLGSQLHPLTANPVVLLSLIFLGAIMVTEANNHRHHG
jgi:hypothetical protein